MKKISLFRKYPPGKVNYLYEIITAIILSLSTVTSAWSAYQSSSWHKVDLELINLASDYRIESLRSSSKAMQFKAIDVSMFLEFAQAYSQDNQVLSDFIYQRFRPEMRIAVDAWVALDPLNNAAAPAAPFYMQQYTLADEIAAEELLTLAEERLNDAQLASQNSDTYAKMTVLFASTLFFSGITTKFNSSRVRVILLILALITFTTGLVVIITSPIM